MIRCGPRLACYPTREHRIEWYLFGHKYSISVADRRDGPCNTCEDKYEWPNRNFTLILELVWIRLQDCENIYQDDNPLTTDNHSCNQQQSLAHVSVCIAGIVELRSLGDGTYKMSTSPEWIYRDSQLPHMVRKKTTAHHICNHRWWKTREMIPLYMTCI